MSTITEQLQEKYGWPKERRAAWMRQKRHEYIKQGLTYEGKPRKRPWNRISAATPEEHEAIVRERRREAMRKWRMRGA